MRDYKIGAIIVLYNPDISHLNKALSIITPQVDTVCLIDNSSIDNTDFFKEIARVRYIPLLQNTGIAHAQNIGLKFFVKKNYDFVIFSDQDSLANENIVAELVNDYNVLSQFGYKVGSVAPLAINTNTGKPYGNPDLDIQKIRQEYNNSVKSFRETTFVMSSFSLYPLSLVREIGGFDDSFFIDLVECEWCWRATQMASARFFIDEDITISHSLGEYRKNIVKNISQSSVFRIYYQYRNYLWCLKNGNTPKKWLLYHGRKFILKTIYYPLFCKPRIQYLKNIIKGVKDGLFLKHIQQIEKFN